MLRVASSYLSDNMGGIFSSGKTKSRCKDPGCGCVAFHADNYGDVGKEERCACGHEVSKHERVGKTTEAMSARNMSDTEALEVTRKATDVPPDKTSEKTKTSRKG